MNDDERSAELHEKMQKIQTLILKALFKPLAKKPPNGAIIDANKPRYIACHCTGEIDIPFQGNY